MYCILFLFLFLFLLLLLVLLYIYRERYILKKDVLHICECTESTKCVYIVCTIHVPYYCVCVQFVLYVLRVFDVFF